MSRKKAHLIKAGLITKVAKTTGKLFSVVAAVSTDKLNLKKIEMASFGCKTCKSEFAGIKSTMPFCVVCGSDEVNEIKNKPIENLAKVAEKDLAGIHCASCGTHNIVSMETAHLLDTKMSCVQCGTDIEYQLDEDEDAISEDLEIEETDSPEDDELENVDIPEVDEEEEEDTLDLDSDETDFTETSELNENDHTGSDAPAKDTKVNTAIESPKVKTPEVTEQDKDAAVIRPAVENSKPATLTDTGTGDDKLVVKTEELCLVNVVEGKLELERYGEKIVATIKGVPVAVLHKDSAKENAGIFHSKSMLDAIKFETKRSTPEKALAAFNFEFAKVSVPLPEIVDKKVEASLKGKNEEVAAKLKDLAEDFQQCISMASVGLSKGAFKGKFNILKASLTENLEALNVRNAKQVVAKIFSQHSNEYHKTLIETANMLMAKSIEARNELAETLGELNPLDDLDEEMEDDESDVLESRLEQASSKKVTASNVTRLPFAETSSVKQLTSIVKQANNGKLF